MPVIYPDNATDAQRNAHRNPKSPHRLAGKGGKGHVNWDDTGSEINERVSLSKVTSAANTPNQRVKATGLSQTGNSGFRSNQSNT